jgi:hypothetical protein
MEDESLKQKLKTLISTMGSKRRTEFTKYGDWRTTSITLLEGVFGLDNSGILQKGDRLICFIFIHEERCNGHYDCTCSTPYSERRIKIYFFSALFAKMVSVLHSQLYFSMNVFDQLCVTSSPIELYNRYETEKAQKTEEIEIEMCKEESPEFQRIRDEFNSLICEYLMLAFTDPTSLPPFLLDVDEGPTMRLSELIAWLESE